MIFGAGFAAVAGIAAALLGQRLGAGATAYGIAIVATFVALCVVLAALGRRSSPRAGHDAAWSRFGHPGRTVARALRLTARARLKPSAATLREAAALLDAADDPPSLARRIGAGGASTVQALELLESLGLLRSRLLRRARPARPTGAALGTRPDLDLADGVASRPPRALARSREVRGLRESWRWTGAAGAVELHAAALADCVLIRDDNQFVRLAPDGSLCWSRPAGRTVACVHFACDGARVAALGERGVVTLLSGENGDRLAQLTTSDAATTVAVAAGGARVWIGDRFGRLAIFDGRARLLREIRVGHPIDFVALASEADVGVVASRRGHVSSVDPVRGETHRTFLRADLHRLWVEEDGERALLVVPADGVLAWNVALGSMETYALDRAIRDAASDAAGDRLAALTFDDRLVVLDGAARVLWQCDAPVGSNRIRMSGDGDRVWCADSAGTVRQLEILDQADADRPVLDLSARLHPPADVDASQAEITTEPEPGGFRRLLIDRRGTVLVLIHPDGRAAIQRESSNPWLVTAPGGTGTGDAVIADDGSAVALALDRGVRRIRTSDGSTRDFAIPSPRLGRVPNGGDIVATTPHGEVWLVSDEREDRIAADLAGLADFSTSSSGEGSWIFWWSGLDGTVSRLDPRTAERVQVASQAELTPPVRLVAMQDRVLIVDASGQLRWFTADGRETARASLSVPIVHAERAGDGAAALTDLLGDVHLAVVDRGVAGTLARPDGILRAGIDPQGEPWLLRVHRRLLLCQSWDGSIHARTRVAGTPLDLASGPAGAWAVLTTAGLFSRGLARSRSSDRARFLEL